MRKEYIPEYSTGQTVVDYFMVRSAEEKTAKNGKAYGQFELADKKGSISAKKWDLTPDDETMLKDLSAGSMVKIMGTVDTFKDVNQIIIQKIRPVTDADRFDVSDVVKAAPYSGEEMYAKVLDIIDSISNEPIKRLCNLIYEDKKEKILYWPAAEKMHHNEMGGFLWHTLRMSQNAMMMCKVYPFINRDLLLAGTILHDIGKIDEIQSNEYGVSPGYSMEGRLLGHLVMGVKLIDQYAEKAGLTEEQSLVLQHLLASHHGKPEYDAAHKPCMLEAQLLYQIDSIDMYVYVAEHELENVEPGEFTDKVYVFGKVGLYRSYPWE